jgi:hypothetical protein
MKLFFVLAVATSTIMLLVQGAPQISSEEMGKAVEQLKELLKSEAAKLASHPREQGYGRPVSIIKLANVIQCKHFHYYSYFITQGTQKFTSVQKDRVTAQVRGIDIRNCGTTGTIINSALAVLNIYSDQFGVLVDCQISPGCVQVRVDVPADDVVADIDVCDLGKSLIIEYCIKFIVH